MKKKLLILGLLPCVAFITSCNKGWNIDTNYSLTLKDTNEYWVVAPGYTDPTSIAGMMRFELPNKYKFNESEKSSYSCECVPVTNSIEGKDMSKFSEFHTSTPNFITNDQSKVIGICFTIKTTYFVTKTALDNNDWFKVEFSGKLIKDSKTLTEFKTKVTFTFKG